MYFLINYLTVLIFIIMDFYKCDQESFILNECFHNESLQTISKQTVHFDKLDRRINSFKPKVINTFNSKLIVLSYKQKQFNNKKCLWLYKPIGKHIDKGNYFLAEYLQKCMTVNSIIVHEPFFIVQQLITNLTGYYIYTEYDDDWTVTNKINYTKSDKNLEDTKFYGLEVTFSPLAIFFINYNRLAHSGYLFRIINYHADQGCHKTKSLIQWMVDWLNSTIPLNIYQEFDEKTANTSYQINYLYKIKNFTCHYLPNDDSPVQLVAYYDINRARISPEGKRDFKETPWEIQNSSWNNLSIQDKQTIALPRPFGIAKRIRLINLKLTDPDIGIQIKLKTRSDEAECDACWGLGHEYPPFETERILPYTYASVYLNQTICQTILQTKRRPKQLWLEWLLIEPIFGRIRTSSGYAIPMNVLDEWKHVRNIMELEIEIKTSKQNNSFTVNKKGQSKPNELFIDKIVFELPEHPEDIDHMEQAIHSGGPTLDIAPRFTRACMSTINDHYTSLTIIRLENPKLCIDLDRNFSRVYQKAKSPRSELISYTIRLVNDEYGNKLLNITGYLLIHIELHTFPRDARKVTHPLGCKPRSSPEGEIMRLAIIGQGEHHVTLYIARWEDRWVIEHGGSKIQSIPVMQNHEEITHRPYCNPYRTNLNMIYTFSNKTLKVLANDTKNILTEVKLDEYPVWMGYELYTDPQNENCTGCYSSILIDRRNLHFPYLKSYKEQSTPINDWHQIIYPRPKNINYMSHIIVSVDQTFEKSLLNDEEKNELENKPKPSSMRLRSRFIKLIRKIGNSLNLSIAVLRASTFCPNGQYQIEHTPAVCVYCQPGTFAANIVPSEIHPVQICKPCPIGEYQNSAGKSKCKKCKFGLSTQREGSWLSTFCVAKSSSTQKIDSLRDTNSMERESYLASEKFEHITFEKTRNWTNENDEIYNNHKFSQIEGPHQILLMNITNLILIMCILIILISFITTLVITSKGLMLIYLTKKSHTLPINKQQEIIENENVIITPTMKPPHIGKTNQSNQKKYILNDHDSSSIGGSFDNIE